MRALYLEELAIFLQEKERLDAESVERKWTLAKQLSKSGRFLSYIQNLESRASCPNVKLISNSKEEAKDVKIEVGVSKSEEIKPLASIQKSTEHKSFYDLQDAIEKSPFKPKEKSLNMTIVMPDTVLDYDFSKPGNTSEEVNVEFARAFRDISQIGSIAKEKWLKAIADKKAFSVRKNEHLDFVKSKNRNEVVKGNLNSKKQLMENNSHNSQSPASKCAAKFNLLREQEHAKLLTLLENRKKDRFNRSKNFKTIQPVFKLIDSDMHKHTAKRQNSVWKETLPHLWIQDPYNQHLKVKAALKAPDALKEQDLNNQNLKVKAYQTPLKVSDDHQEFTQKSTLEIKNTAVKESLDLKARSAWIKLRATTRFKHITTIPPEPIMHPTSVDASDFIRSEFKELLEK